MKVLRGTQQFARTKVGTPLYMAPEVLMDKAYNHQADMWSLGCVLYELCTLAYAFNGPDMKTLFRRICRAEVPPLPGQFSDDLRSLVTSLLAKDPAHRPSTNAVLTRPLVRHRISRFLSEHEMAHEFSHTVLHGQHLADRPSVVRQPEPQPLGGGGGAMGGAYGVQRRRPSAILQPPPVAPAVPRVRMRPPVPRQPAPSPAPPPQPARRMGGGGGNNVVGNGLHVRAQALGGSPRIPAAKAKPTPVNVGRSPRMGPKGGKSPDVADRPNVRNRPVAKTPPAAEKEVAKARQSPPPPPPPFVSPPPPPIPPVVRAAPPRTPPSPKQPTPEKERERHSPKDKEKERERKEERTPPQVASPPPPPVVEIQEAPSGTPRGGRQLPRVGQDYAQNLAAKMRELQQQVMALRHEGPSKAGKGEARGGARAEEEPAAAVKAEEEEEEDEGEEDEEEEEGEEEEEPARAEAPTTPEAPRQRPIVGKPSVVTPPVGKGKKGASPMSAGGGGGGGKKGGKRTPRKGSFSPEGPGSEDRRAQREKQREDMRLLMAQHREAAGRGNKSPEGWDVPIMVGKIPDAKVRTRRKGRNEENAP